MNKKEISPGIFFYYDVLSNYNLHLEIDKFAESGAIYWKNAYVHGGYNKNVRDTQTITVPYNKEYKNISETLLDEFNNSISNLFLKDIGEIEKDYMRTFGIFFDTHYNYELLKYSKGQNFASHVDDHPKYHRRISIVHYFNDDYEGGEIEFPWFNKKIKPKANSTIIFPSDYVYRHSVSPVTEGIRYSMASWIK